MSPEIIQKREELKALSAGYKILIKEGAINSVNEGLAMYYAEQGHTTLKSFMQWKKEGFSVKKGSKALLMWGEPIERKRKENQPPQEGEKEELFYPLAFLFSNLQVEKNETPAKAL